MRRPLVLLTLVASIALPPFHASVTSLASGASRATQAPQRSAVWTPDVVATLAFTEGPTWAPDGSLFFADLINKRVMRLLPTGALTTFRENSNLANGLLIDAAGRLLACEGGTVERPGIELTGTPRVTRTDLRTGAVEILAASGPEFTLVGPNDLTHDGRGTIYFTDFAGHGVYRIDRSGTVTRLLGPGSVNRPNGVQLSPDGTTLYLVETGVGDEPRRMVRRYRVAADGSLQRVGIVHGFFTADGMSIDVDGNLYVSGGKDEDRNTGTALRVGVYVIRPDGTEKAFHPVRATFTGNNGFGGSDMKTLFIAGDDRIFRVQNDVAGLPR